jgi:hypothetical protein
MWPYLVPDYEFTGYVYRNRDGSWKGQSIEAPMVESEVKHIWDCYVDFYQNDPLFGTQEENLKAPPVDRLYAIYGINLKTENFYFYKESPGLTKLELDPSVCSFLFFFFSIFLTLQEFILFSIILYFY